MISPTIQQIRCFHEVAQSGGFRAAAVRLRLGQSTVTAAIQQLEEIVGIELFTRTTRRVELTRGGQQFLPLAVRLMDDFEKAMEALADFKAGNQGSITVQCEAATIQPLLGPAIRRFLGQHPQVRLSIRHDFPEGIASHVMTGEADFGIGRVLQADAGLHRTPLATDVVGILCHPGHRLAAAGSPATWEQLAGHPFVSSGDGWLSYAGDRAPEILQRLPAARHKVDSVEMFVRLMEQEGGYTLTTAFTARGQALRSLVFRPMTAPELSWPIELIRRTDRPLTPAAALLADEILAEASLSVPSNRDNRRSPAPPAEGAAPAA